MTCTVREVIYDIGCMGTQRQALGPGLRSYLGKYF